MKKNKFKYPFKGTDITCYQDNFSQIKDIKSDLVFSDCENKEYEVSVVIPTYNSHFIKDAILSALSQDNAPEYEIVIVDNASDEELFIDVLDFVKQCVSKKIRLYRNPTNIGMVGNWNRCIELASSRYLIFLHSDDLLLNNSLNVLWYYHKMLDNDAAILAKEQFIDVNGKIISCAPLFKNSILRNIINKQNCYKFNKYNLFHADMDSGCAALFSKMVLLKSGGFYGDYYPNIDGAGILHYYMLAPIYRINTYTRKTRIAENASISNGTIYPSCSYYTRIQIVDKFFHGNIFFKFLIRLNSESMSNSYFGITPLRKLNILERAIQRLERDVYTFRNKYNL